MDPNGTSPVPQSRTQPSIRSFFQPRSPNYAPPPGTATRQPQPQPQLQPKPSISTSQIPASLPPPPPPPPPPTPTPALPPQATISQVTEHHIQPLRRINSLLLPIPYPDSFYASILTTPPPSTPSFSRTITWSDPLTSTSTAPKVIGGIICRLEPCPDSPSPSPSHQIYIASLALLSPYRSLGLATATLKDIISSAVQSESESEAGNGSGGRIESVYAHVWTQNQEGLEWYAHRGFHREANVLVGYYRKLRPDTAFVLRRKITPSDYLNSLPQPSQPLTKPNAEVEVQVQTNGNADGKGKRPDGLVHARSFQEKGPEREWNDLPEDVLGSGNGNGSGLLKPQVDDGSAASSRSSSRSGKKKRVYPAAAFGS